jgi:4-hydroxybenzoate polyprenyltransferase
MKKNKSLFIKRFYTYQKERFPFLGYIVLIGVFTFSAASYSRICRGEDGFIDWKNYLVGVITTFSLFFLVRIFDEFKDKEDDAKYRKYLPVPRGLISLKELSVVGFCVAAIQLFIILFFQQEMIFLYAVVMGYLLLMRVEFFIPEWLKKHQLIYVVSHMFIIPIIDVYASGLDWFLEGVNAPVGLLFFFAVSFMNGIVLEFGRKIKSPEYEEDGVLSYTKYFGTKKAVWVWISVLSTTLILSLITSYYASYGLMAYYFFGTIFFICVIPVLLFIKKPSAKSAKYIEDASSLWTVFMYLGLGGIPMISKLIF